MSRAKEQLHHIMSNGYIELGKFSECSVLLRLHNDIDVIRFDNAKIHIKEYLNGQQLPNTLTYQPAIIKMIGARLLVINPDNQEEYYDCRYEDCTIKRING